MRLLLDTQIVLWQLQGSRTMRGSALEAIEAATELAFSVVSFAEIGVETAIGKHTSRASCASTSCAAASTSLAWRPIAASASPSSPCTTGTPSTGC